MCTPYYLADFNGVVLADRARRGYSEELSFQCLNFFSKYEPNTRCRGFQEGGGMGVAAASDLKTICARNESQRAPREVPPGTIIVKSRDPQVMPWKIMIMDAETFNFVRSSSRDLSQRKVFTNGATDDLQKIIRRKNPSYCLYSATEPLKDHDIFQVTDYTDTTGDNSQRLRTFNAKAYRAEVAASWSCVGGPKTESPEEILKRHLGRAAVIN